MPPGMLLLLRPDKGKQIDKIRGEIRGIGYAVGTPQLSLSTEIQIVFHRSGETADNRCQQYCSDGDGEGLQYLVRFRSVQAICHKGQIGQKGIFKPMCHPYTGYRAEKRQCSLPQSLPLFPTGFRPVEIRPQASPQTHQSESYHRRKGDLPVRACEIEIERGRFKEAEKAIMDNREEGCPFQSLRESSFSVLCSLIHVRLPSFFLLYYRKEESSASLFTSKIFFLPHYFLQSIDMTGFPASKYLFTVSLIYLNWESLCLGYLSQITTFPHLAILLQAIFQHF